MSSLSCPHCQETGAPPEGALHWRCGRCASLLFVPRGGPAVVLGHHDDNVATHIGDTLAAADFNVQRALHGAQVMGLLQAGSVAALVIDVALSEVTAFRVVEAVRANPTWASIKVVLVASVYSKTAYKRRPTSLYGADDYIEQHHIHDMLVPKLVGLLEMPSARNGAPHAEMRPPLADMLRVHALAYSIVADIALYHQTEVQGAVAGEQPAGLKAALQEGRQLLLSMVSAKNFPTADPIGDAFIAFIEEMRRLSQ